MAPSIFVSNPDLMSEGWNLLKTPRTLHTNAVVSVSEPKGIKPVLQSDVTTTAQFTVLG